MKHPDYENGTGRFDKKLKMKKERNKRIKFISYVFKNRGQLCDYQMEWISWLLFNYLNKRNSILADEIGLGKTI